MKRKLQRNDRRRALHMSKSVIRDLRAINWHHGWVRKLDVMTQMLLSIGWTVIKK